MKKEMKIVLILLCTVLLMASLSACSTVTVDKDKEVKQVVAVVGETQLLKGEFNLRFEYMLSSYGYDESFLEDPANKETVIEMKKQVLDIMVSDEASYQYALANGLDLTDAEKKAVEDEVNANVESIRDNIRSQVEADTAADTNIDIKAETERKFSIMMDGYDKAREISDTIRYKVLQKYQDSMTKDVTVTEAEAKASYDAEVANQKLMVEKPQMYALLEQMGSPVYVYPEGIKTAKHILIAIPSDKQNLISAYRTDKDDASADKVLQEELVKIKQKADEALKKVKAGEDFDVLIEQYGEDPGMTAEPSKTEGYKIFEGSSYVEPFIQGTLALQKVGDTSDLVASDFGYHIIKLIEIPNPVVPFEEVKENIISTMQSNAVQKTIFDKNKELVEAANPTVYYNRL